MHFDINFTQENANKNWKKKSWILSFFILFWKLKKLEYISEKMEIIWGILLVFAAGKKICLCYFCCCSDHLLAQNERKTPCCRKKTGSKSTNVLSYPYFSNLVEDNYRFMSHALSEHGLFKIGADPRQPQNHISYSGLFVRIERNPPVKFVLSSRHKNPAKNTKSILSFWDFMVKSQKAKSSSKDKKTSLSFSSQFKPPGLFALCSWRWERHPKTGIQCFEHKGGKSRKNFHV